MSAVTRLRVRLDRQLARLGERSEHASKRRRLGERRCAASDEDRLHTTAEPPPLPVELGHERVGVRTVLAEPPDGRDEVAVAAAVDAEGQVDVEMADAALLHHPASRSSGADDGMPPPEGGVQSRHFLFSPSRLRTARNASCGTSTPPTCFMRFLPFFCFSSSLRLRVMSPP